MPRYIDADATIELLKSLGSRDYRREKGTICEAIKMLQYPEYTPTADVAPKSEVALEAVYDFQSRLRGIFCAMCDGNDYNKLGLLEIDSAIERLFDTFVAELKKKYTEGQT